MPPARGGKVEVGNPARRSGESEQRVAFGRHIGPAECGSLARNSPDWLRDASGRWQVGPLYIPLQSDEELELASCCMRLISAENEQLPVQADKVSRSAFADQVMTRSGHLSSPSGGEVGERVPATLTSSHYRS